MTTLAQQPRSLRASMGLMVAAVFFFSLLDALAKGLAEDYPANQLTFFRMFFGLIPVLLVMLRDSRDLSAFKTRRPFGHLARAVTALGSIGFFFAALPYLPLAEAVALSYSETLFIALLAVPLLREPLGWRQALAAVAGFLGVLLIVRPSGEGLTWLGPALVLISAIFGAGSVIQVRRLGRTESSALIVFYFTLIGTLVSGLSLAFAWVTPSWEALGRFVLLGITGGIGQILLTAAFRDAPAASISPFNYTALVWAALFGYLIWGETIAPLAAAGALLIVASGVFLVTHEGKAGRGG